MRRPAPLLLLLAFATMAAACLTPAPIEGALCSKERRCPTEFLCQGAQCNPEAPFVQSLLCEADTDCQAGSHCHPTDGLCVQCHRADHCLTGLCTASGTCASCAADADCLETGRCNAYGYCAACTADAHCPSAMRCLPGLGQCVQEDRRGATRSGRDGRPMEGP